MNLTTVLQQYRDGERGLPDYNECMALAADIHLMHKMISGYSELVKEINSMELPA